MTATTHAAAAPAPARFEIFNLLTAQVLYRGTNVRPFEVKAEIDRLRAMPDNADAMLSTRILPMEA